MSAAGIVAVLVEGRSDVAAVTALMRSAGVGGDRSVEVVDMGGVTNIRRELDRFAAPGRARRILGLCDAGEASIFRRALESHEVPLNGPDDMARFGFHVCRSDLEDELIRALGTEKVLEIITDLGIHRRFDRFCQQLYWRDRDLHDRLHRFTGIASGRKLRVARAMAEATPWADAPKPLRDLVGQLADALGSAVPAPLHPFGNAERPRP